MEREITDCSDHTHFLTVLLRTQGDRLNCLQDALLCLAAQTDRDFDVICLVHNAEPESLLAVHALVASVPQWLRERIRVVEVNGGTRARPLNAGVEEARGSYIAVYDDDDLLFADWVEQFHTAAKAAPRRIIRACVVTQQIEPAMWRSGAGLRSISLPEGTYPASFDPLDHFRQNRSPFMSLAFPRELFSVFGLRFDQTLDVCEDWDFLLQASQLCGVEQAEAITAIYRRWNGGTHSAVTHSESVWRSNEKRIIAKLASSPVMLPTGSAHRLHRDVPETVVETVADSAQLEAILNSTSWRVTKPIRHAARIAKRVRRRR
ncbi:glycosyltransferase family A protein [Skermania sp. ID1734]|uniref:glycosyltransferase family A protein n=1 Tax=Skermania sp. ID1734 TaxID=2597516 RepID=UPI001C8F5D9F|nr:glycosyltransferase family A protein [Skermania sp. ID1734]